jgi:predicted GIY-YIG superfamily endonuclease
MGAHRRSQRPRSQASYGPETGTTYLLHFDRPYRHARHYVGWTQNLAARLEAHARGRGARLVEVAANAGIGFTLARTWPESTRDREDIIKHAGGARRYCPECGVTPRDRQQAVPAAPPDDRRPHWQMDRDGQWADDGTPIIYDPGQTWAQARAEAERHPVHLTDEDRAELAALDEVQRRWTQPEEQVGLKDAVARAADRVWAPMRERAAAARAEAAHAEADRLWAIADELDKQIGRRPGRQYELTAERAARIRALIGEDLVQDARAQAQAAERSHEPVLQGAERDAEIDRLAGQLGEAEPLFGPRPDGTYADAIDSDMVAERDAPGDPYGSPERAEAGPESAHFGNAPGEPQDAGHWPVLQADYGRMHIGHDPHGIYARSAGPQAEAV